MDPSTSQQYKTINVLDFIEVIMARIKSILVTALLLDIYTQVIPYSEYIPSFVLQRSHLATVHQVKGRVLNAEALVGEGSGTASFIGVSAVTYDFDKSIAAGVALLVRIGEWTATIPSTLMVFATYVPC